MAKPDRHFINVFSAVLGILVAIALLLIGVSRFVDSGPKGALDVDDPLMQAEAHERIKPFGQVAVAGSDNISLAVETPTAAVTSPVPAGESPVVAARPADGKATYEMACIVCHGAGIAGAPRVGDQGAWATRIAQGMPTLHKHALQGFQGTTGVMPAKGGRVDLSDDAVTAATEYMVSLSR